MNKNYFEIIIGVIVTVVTITFFLSARNTAEVNIGKQRSSYLLQANFGRIDGVEVGSDVRIAGIKVGSVSDLKLDNESYEAILQIAVSDDIKIPEDSYIAIISSGLLGGKYVDIEPGIEEVYLNEGDKFAYTRSSISLESLLSKFLFKS